MATRRLFVALAILALAWPLGWIVRQRRRIRWRPPGEASAHRTLAARVIGDRSARPIVLLHGLAGSASYWGAEFDRLAERGRVVVPDLLGFAASPRPASGYGPDDHAAALLGLLAEVGAEGPRVLVGHSLGGLVALALTATRPAAVSAIVAFAPPLYRDRGSARRHVARSTNLGGLFALDTPTARAICMWHEAHPEAARMIAPLFRPDLPAAIARDAVRHTWASYSETLVRLILDVPAVGWLPSVTVPVHLVAGADDDTLDLGFLEDLARRHPHVSLTVWPSAGHHLPLTHPEACLADIRAVT
jgi:pimeloyl-ACP methyl ester carboxylesterase